MNFFGGSNCGNTDRGDFHGGNGGNCGTDCCSLIFLLLLLQNCGGGMKDCEICIDLNTILLLSLISNCGFGCGCNK